MTEDAGVNVDPSPLAVAYLLHRFPYKTETFIVREMHGLRELGVDVSIFSLMTPGSDSASDQGDRLLAVAHYAPAFSGRVALANLRMLLRHPGRYIRSLIRLVGRTWREPPIMGLMTALFPKTVFFASEIERLGVDHVHAHFVWLEGLAAGVVRDLTGIPFTIEPHAFGLFGRNQKNVALELADATGIVTISDYNRRHIVGLDPQLASKIDVVHCGVDLDRFPPSPQRPENERVKILSIGRAVEKKGHEYLIDACAILARRGVEFECDMVVGLDEPGVALAKRVAERGLSDRVRVHDMMGEREIVDMLHGADLFALACVVASGGDRDGIPVAIMEAMACELPVVSTTVSGVPELVRAGESGLLAPPRDAEGLADALGRLIGDPEQRRRMGQVGRSIIAEAFDTRVGVGQMRRIFEAHRRPGQARGVGRPA
jgi:glycosyltransferase involved in cell wall biosynthesis